MSEWGFVNAPGDADDDNDEYEDDEDFESDPAHAANSGSNKKSPGNSASGPGVYNANKPPIRQAIQMTSLTPVSSAPSPRVATKLPSIGGNKLPAIN